MSPVIKKPGLYKIDDLFKEGNEIYDKEDDNVFIYIKKIHKKLIKLNPNNYRVAHRGDSPTQQVVGV
tara:strand:- start:658 stop:858 length:201 start_codon:yes stop_codon:yes gene_type:complete